MIAFVTYAMLVASVLGLAAARAEAALRARGFPGRWVWLASLAASVGAGAWALIRPPVARPAPTVGWGGAPVTYLADLATVATPTSPWLPWVEGVATVLWGVGSVGMALLVVGGVVRLSHRARSWTPAQVAGGRVFVSEDFGPAVTGILAPKVVLPRWALALEPERLRLVVLHEEEHRRAGDVALLLAGTLFVVLAPWNPALWWQLRRLRAAVEMDCDARVLRRGAPASLYARLLLDLGIQGAGIPLPVAALSRSPSLLERRLTMIVRGEKRGSTGRALGAAAVAAALVVVACETPMPTAVRPTDEVAEGQQSVVVPGGTLKAEQVLVDVAEGMGQPMYLVDGERVQDLSGLHPEHVVKVEVVKGGAAEALFGEEARGGVVRVLTKDAPRELLALAEADGDELHFEASEAKAGVKADVMNSTLTVKASPDGVTPRVFVDGEPFDGDMASIARDKIDRVEVVKGKEGERPAIYITLKR